MEKMLILTAVNFLWSRNMHMKEFNHKIHFVEQSNKNSYYEMKYKVAEIYTKLFLKKHTRMARVH
jgi:hypothetical protein